ncbi:Leishmanolysin peptidase [Trichostrongylus colubriformis]|uniref:Leishmanolysin-like peptidase n=1 Tax=Trichostrongylus colubriformis TaxID=6319 RepID=A0AAN8IS02_TRICO
MLLKKLMTQARDFFEDTVKVERVKWIQLTAECKGNTYITAPDEDSLCQYDCLPRCGTAKIPRPIFKRLPASNWESVLLCSDDALIRTLKHTDFALFVAVTDEACLNATLAYASHCSVDSKTKRKDPIFIIPGVLEKFTRTDWETRRGAINHDVYMIVTPKVREEARKFFNCPTLEGAEIENQGGAGTRGAHWEKRVLENEAMTGVTTQVYAISRITFALFEDSGWYQMDYDKADNMTWGKGLGCDFAKKSCLTWMKSKSGPFPFCTKEGDMTCSANRKAKVICNFVEGMPMPDIYDYNEPNLYTDRKGKPTHGGGTELTADYCPYYRVFGELSVEASDTRCTYPGNMHYNNYSLEIFSRTARCFALSGKIKIRKKLKTITYIQHAGCYEVTLQKFYSSVT